MRNRVLHGRPDRVSFDPDRGLSRDVYEPLAACRWIAASENLILTGATGTGKTFVACALGRAAIDAGFEVTYARVSLLTYDLTRARQEGLYVELLAGLASSDLLILDDWGLGRHEPGEHRALLDVLEDREDVASTLITSHLQLDEWHDFVGDPAVASAFIDRVRHRAHHIELRGGSLRGRPEPTAAQPRLASQAWARAR